MGTTSQATISSSNPRSPRQLLDQVLANLHGDAQVEQHEDGSVVLRFPGEGREGGPAPVGSSHLRAGAETLLLDVVAPDSHDLERIEALLTQHVRSIDMDAASALHWRRHE